jgi:signal transduction histidine kinase
LQQTQAACDNRSVDMTETTLPGRRTETGIGFALVGGGFLLTVASAILDVTDTPRTDRAGAIAMQALCVLLPVGLGLFRLTRRRDDRFARLLIVTGLTWSIVTFAQSSDSTLYSIGRASVWVVEAMIVYLLLAFPDGHLRTRVERRLFGATLLVLGVMYLPSALFAQFPTPAPWSSCGTACPHNALLVGHGAESFFDDIVRPVREALTLLIFAGVAAVLVQRARRGPRLIRRVLVPVAVVAAFRALALGLYDGLRADGQTSGFVDVVGALFVLSLALVTVSFAIGLLDRRLFVAEALQRLTRRLRPHVSAGDLRVALADALEDPSVKVVYWLGDRGKWVDETGWPVKAPEAEDGRAVTEVSADGRRIAAILHDDSFAQDPALVQAAASYALTALENDRLVGNLRASVEELSQSRARIVAVGDRERRRIERDLHDGAQQRLVALRVRLGLMAERLDTDSPADAGAIRELGDQVEETIDDVRSFARGIYPSLLAERGLTEALRAAGRSALVPTTVDAAGVGRYAPEVEATVYFSCVEALQNATKHAHGARGVSITLRHNPHLRFEVADDGCGFDPADTGGGAGITNLRDRLEAAGGELHVESAPGAGTRISGMIPGGS